MAASSTPGVPGPTSLDALRGTPEYSALFDLEIWRSEQKKRFLASLDAERQALRSSIEAEYARIDSQRVAELDQFRKELEAMALTFKQSGEALQARLVALEKREAAFDARRLQMAREHEGILLAAESRARQVREEMKLQVDLLRSELVEKERLVDQTLQRLASVSSEFESLQSTMTRIQSEEFARRGEVQLLTERLHEANGTIRALREELTAATRTREDAQADQGELRAACAHYKHQLKDLAAQHNLLLKELSEEKMKAIARERETLATQSASVGRPPAEGLPPLPQLHRMAVPPAPSPSQGASDIAALRHLIAELVDVTSREEKADEQRDRAARQRRRDERRQHKDYHFRYAPLRDPAASTVANIAPIPTVERHAAERVAGSPPRVSVEHPLNGPAEPATAHELSVSSLSDTARPASPERSPPRPRTAGSEPLSSASDLNRSGELPYVTLSDAPPLASRVATWNVSPRQSADATEPSPPSTGAQTTVPSHPSTDPSLSAAKGNEARGDASRSAVSRAPMDAEAHNIEHFIARLQNNHDRLLESGVYSREDSLIQEMERKIAVYEALLRSHRN